MHSESPESGGAWLAGLDLISTHRSQPDQGHRATAQVPEGVREAENTGGQTGLLPSRWRRLPQILFVLILKDVATFFKCNS